MKCKPLGCSNNVVLLAKDGGCVLPLVMVSALAVFAAVEACAWLQQNVRMHVSVNVGNRFKQCRVLRHVLQTCIGFFIELTGPECEGWDSHACVLF
ncbi:MAG: hypothetical protein RMN51_07490 [Verrucomicrobiota bacterium]|nr:hypothetical protein [Limisphaera sp.]MDW8381931.1 hypothetical protein [Verrucomicrobiota bacterium]